MARGKNTRIKLVGGEITFSMRDPQFIEAKRPLDHYETGARDFTPTFKEYEVYHRRSIARNFAAQGRPSKWRPLKPATIAERIRLGYGPGPILVRSGKLRAGFTFSYGPQSYRVGNKMHYFPYHQLGAPAAHIPARPMVTLLPQDMGQFTRLARKHLGATE